MNLFRKKPIRIQVVRQDEGKLSLFQWRQDPALCVLASKVLADPNVKLLVSVLRNEHPARAQLPLSTSMDNRIIHQARAEGYEMCLANLQDMTDCTAPMPMPQALFEPESIEQ